MAEPTFAWEFEDSAPSATPEEQAAAQVAAIVAEAANDVDQQMAEAERRLAKAAYYKAIVQNGVVEEDGSSQANEVNAEARVWARQRMADLLGLTPVAPPAPPPVAVELPFTDREILALKKLVEKMVAAGAVAAEPVVKKVPAPPTPKVNKVGAPKPPTAPPTATPSVPVPPPAPEAAKKRGRPAKGTMKISALPGQKINYHATNPDGSFIIPSGQPFEDVDGQIYRFVDNRSFDPERTEERMRAQGATDEEVQRFASHPRIKSKVTKRGSNATKPMPDRQMMEGISAAQSTATLNSGTSASASSPYGGDPHATESVFAHAAAASLKQ